MSFFPPIQLSSDNEQVITVPSFVYNAFGVSLLLLTTSTGQRLTYQEYHYDSVLNTNRYTGRYIVFCKETRQ